MTHTHRQPQFARRIFEFVRESRAQQDNEQWHLLILEELIQKKGIRESLLRHRVVPQLLALAYYHVSWLLYVVRPSLSYRLNADFEDHAEHEYMAFVHEHPELEAQPYDSAFSSDYAHLPRSQTSFARSGSTNATTSIRARSGWRSLGSHPARRTRNSRADLFQAFLLFRTCR